MNYVRPDRAHDEIVLNAKHHQRRPTKNKVWGSVEAMVLENWQRSISPKGRGNFIKNVFSISTE